MSVAIKPGFASFKFECATMQFDDRFDQCKAKTVAGFRATFIKAGKTLPDLLFGCFRNACAAVRDTRQQPVTP